MTNHQRIKTRRALVSRLAESILTTMELRWWPAIVIYALACAVVIANRLGTP